MSNVSGPPNTDFDFWEFAACTKCQLPFSTSHGPPVPFWLTECGHVVCNNHLNADQSCTKCGAQGIQLVPLQQEMEAPMSDWFRSIPSALDAVAYAAKFQQETMASQIRYFKARQYQLRNLLERCKRDIDHLKKDNQILVSENEQLRLHSGYGRHSHTHDNHIFNDAPNSSGKRVMMGSQQCDQNSKRPKTISSPHDVVTPLAPNRLTLPPGQQVPELSSNRQGQDGDRQPAGQHDTFAPQHRPASSRLIEQYAYVPPETPQFRPQLSRAQAGPKVFQRTHPQQNQNKRPQDRPQQPDGQQATLPPTSSSRFKPAQQAQKSKTTMGPPSTPQHVRQQVSPMNLQAMQFSNDFNDPASGSAPRMSLRSGNRFVPQNRCFVPPSMGQRTVSSSGSGAPQRFFAAPGTANLVSASDKAFASDSNQQAFSRTASMSGEGQRLPFTVGGGFG